uniref:NADH:quinone oxidoreductase/Mrp antiporter transmembrane domain-containing protein n=1 Tax=Eiseniibacteriota bacterium TaxID=2212470 RepID=A0A832MMD3_UNCEI
MALAELDGMLLACAAWGLTIAVLLPVALVPRRLAAPLPLARAVAVLASLALAACGARGLAGAFPAPLEWWPGLPGDPFRLGVDALSAPFVLLLGALAAASFAAGDHGAAGAGARARLALQAGFVLALAAAFTAGHALLLLVAWEGMTLLSASLVASDVRSARARTATYVYLAVSHAGGACLAAGVLALAAAAGSFQLAEIAAAAPRLPAADVERAAWLVTAGGAVKLGLVPLHVWLPLAHAEAPAPASALLSGAMVKAGLYVLLRFAWQVPGAPPPAWGELLLAGGVVTALAGALYAAFESDAKRLLAHSTVKHAGLLALALGLAASLARAGRWDLAGMALAACLYHAVGHGLAKGLAFLAVGEAVHAAGTRDLEQLGGLARRLPRVSVAALMAALALCGLPLLPCFAGEWLVVQALLRGYGAGGDALRLLVPFAAAGLALATAVAAAALVKLYGIGFLGRPRSAAAAAATAPADRAAERAMLALAALAAGWGVLAPWAVAALHAPVAALAGPALDAAALAPGAGLALRLPGGSGLSPAALLALAAAAGGGMALLLGALGLRRPPRRAPSWACGVTLDARMQYGALGLTKPLRRVFEPVLRIERAREPAPGDRPWFQRAYRHRSGVPPLVERALYAPLVQAVLWTSERARRLQAGSLRAYLAYLLAALVALLLFAR